MVAGSFLVVSSVESGVRRKFGIRNAKFGIELSAGFLLISNLSVTFVGEVLAASRAMFSSQKNISAVG